MHIFSAPLRYTVAYPVAGGFAESQVLIAGCNVFYHAHMSAAVYLGTKGDYYSRVFNTWDFQYMDLLIHEHISYHFLNRAAKRSL